MPRFPAIPRIHFMAAAPLDAWVRLVLTPGARIGWRYWPRVLVNLVLSACVTVITLPERLLLAPILWWRGRRTGWRLGPVSTEPAARAVGHPPVGPELADDTRVPDRSRDRLRSREQPTLVILGYYRTGTTHLHNLLACDPASHTPRWGQVLAPQGFVLSWFVLKLFLWAVLPTKRPQDDMAFGPEWPGEDDFALSNWTLASPLPGRVILPQSYEHFRRFHDLERLTTRERSRWRRTQWAIVWKISLLAPRRRLLLKTPPHTARILALTDVLGGPGRVKFIHLSREPAAVLKSNQRLMKAMTHFHLQDAPADSVIRDRLIDEYAQTERRFLLDAPAIPPRDLVRLRYQDLIADPIGELTRAYAQLELPLSSDFERRLSTYLDSIREYRSETQKLADKPPAALDPAGPSVPGALQWMIPAFGHDRPTRETAFLRTRESPEHTRKHKAPRALLLPALVAILGLALWLLTAHLAHYRQEAAAWLIGVAIGHTATRRSPGSISRGLLCAALSLLVTVIGVAFATQLVDFRVPPPNPNVRAAVWRHLTHESTILWTVLGMVSAFRLGSRRFGAVPGT